MLNESEFQELIENIRKKHPDTAAFTAEQGFAIVGGKEVKSGADLHPDLLRDLSEYFQIEVDRLRKCTHIEVDLLLDRTVEDPKYAELFPSVIKSPFKYEQSWNDFKRRIEMAGGATNYIRQLQQKKQKPPEPPADPELGKR